MIEPKIRSVITKWLPEDHWMLALSSTDIWACKRCRFVVYKHPKTKANRASDDYGTLVTWIEHGLVDGGADGESAELYPLCILCFRSYQTSTPDMHEWWFLNDDGTPQEPRTGDWQSVMLVEQAYTGVDTTNPPMEAEGFERVPEEGSGPPRKYTKTN